MRRICFIIDSIFTIGGVQRVTAVIAKELAKDCDVTIVTLDKPQLKDMTYYGLDETNIHIQFLHFNKPPRFKNMMYRCYSCFYRKCLYYLNNSKDTHFKRYTSDLYSFSSFPPDQRNQLFDILYQEDFNVVIGVHAPLAARLASLKKQLPNMQLLGWIHNSFEALFNQSSLYIGPDRQRHYVYQLRKLDKTIVLCEHDAESYHNYDSEFKPAVIYNPLTLVPGERSEGNSKHFLAVGRFSRLHKGFDLLIDAFHLFAKKDKEWMLDIVGEGPEEEMLRKKIAEYNLNQRIILHPFTHHIQDYYSKAQIYILSSRWEGFGLVLVEAMAHGLPIVSSDLPTSKEIMGDFGLYFENGNVEQLAQRMAEATQINWQQKSKEAIEISKRFSIDSIIKQWKAIIDE